MALTRAIWTHGHAVKIEHPDRLVSVSRVGQCVVLEGKPDQKVWVHYAIPTPVIVSDERLSAHSVMIRCRTVQKNDAWIAAVHVWDGENRIATHDGLRHVSKDWSWPRYEIPGPPEVRWGIGLSIQVGFTELLYADFDPTEYTVERMRLEPFLDHDPRFRQPPPREGPPPNHIMMIAAVGCDFVRG